MANNGQGQNNVEFNLAILQQQPPYKGLLRPDQITPQAFPFLTASELSSYPSGVTSLWKAIGSRPADDAQHIQALNKLRQLTGNVLKKYNEYKAKLAEQRAAANASQQQDGPRPSSQGQTQPQSQVQVQQQPPQQTQTQTQTQTQPQPQAQQLPQPQLTAQSQTQLPPQSQIPPHPQTQPQQRNTAQMASNGQYVLPQEVLGNIKQQVDSVVWEASITMAANTAEGWRLEAKRRYTEALVKQAEAKDQALKIESLIQQARSQGREIQPGLLEAKAKAQQKFNEAGKFIENILTQNRLNAEAHQAARNAAAAANAQSSAQPMHQASANGGAQSRPPSQGQSLNAQGPINPSIDVTRPQQQLRPGSPALPVQQQQQQQQQQMQQQQQHQQQQQTQMSMPQMPQMPHNIMDSRSQPSAFTAPRPQPTPTQSAQFSHNQHQSPQSMMPVSNMGSGPANAPAPLTAQAAIAASQRSYSSQPQGLPQAISGSGSGSASRPDLEKSNSKQWPPMNKSWVPTAPQPVSMGPARPTLTGVNNGPMGVMGQPAIQKQPPFLLQGAGDRVLDKKKLDELVRQVTGGSGDGLHPEVEESVLQLADEFIDNVITGACKLAKLRGSNTLEIRDIQLILERQYNIRVPGYATDEIRTVRKVQPAAGYLQKMNAVQAAKVMGGKTDI